MRWVLTHFWLLISIVLFCYDTNNELKGECKEIMTLLYELVSSSCLRFQYKSYDSFLLMSHHVGNSL